ncbi:hypothetical protein ACFQS1_25545 [Paractinoplanes rhizophilus]|jgi:hypothetical protein|uniref:Heavy metal-binding domain-containing protein n=1 Tax=Paractinoplanes rhizophilus TaxID=1416877 RepID=A0ABW2HX02_9ACTN|nr:hypothetical protein [Actinoplanes sp.]
MNAAGKLSLFAAGVAVVFGASFAVGAVVVPDGAVAAREAKTGSAGHDGMAADGEMAAAEDVRGLGVAADGLVLSPVEAPAKTGVDGELSLRIVDAGGAPVTGFATSHEKQLHLIVVRADGAEFRHVHPRMDAAGTWTVPWRWTAAGTYRVFADFVPAGRADAGSITLTRTLQIGGAYAPVTPRPHATDDVDGFHVAIDGDLTAGATSELTVTITRDGKPVTALEPYLGSFGHLVALREGDLGYLHVHAETGATSGPAIRFGAEVPTAGRYLLYLDFKIGGKVRTADFVLDGRNAR